MLCRRITRSECRIAAVEGMCKLRGNGGGLQLGGFNSSPLTASVGACHVASPPSRRFRSAAALSSPARSSTRTPPQQSPSAAAPPPSHVDPGVTPAPGTRTALLSRSLPLSLGGELASPLRLNYFDSAWEDLDGEAAARRKPVVLVMPSMSHSALVTRGEQERARQEKAEEKARRAATATATGGVKETTTSSPKGWWESMVGRGSAFGIDLAEFRVVSASPLGTPYGSTSPLTPDPSLPTDAHGSSRAYRASFPLITPLDQARLQACLLDHLGIDRVHAVVGSSMGGMQALQFVRLYPQRYQRLAALCTTPQTSSSTQALRAVQRAAVRSDPEFREGNYADHHPTHAATDGSAAAAGLGPVHGMAIARMFGTICYRSREEFDVRFDHRPKEEGVRAIRTQQQQHRSQPPHLSPPAASSPLPASSSPSVSSLPPLFDVESYLRHQASTFTSRFDANCYLALSLNMDLMDMAQREQVQVQVAAAHGGKEQGQHVAAGFTGNSIEQVCGSIPRSAQFLLLPVASDALIPAAELERLGSTLGAQGKRVHCERVHSLLGHDAFLKDTHTFGPRLRAFLDTQHEDGVEQVRRYVSSLHDL